MCSWTFFCFPSLLLTHPTRPPRTICVLCSNLRPPPPIYTHTHIHTCTNTQTSRALSPLATKSSEKLKSSPDRKTLDDHPTLNTPKHPELTMIRRIWNGLFITRSFIHYHWNLLPLRACHSHTTSGWLYHEVLECVCGNLNVSWGQSALSMQSNPC